MNGSDGFRYPRGLKPTKTRIFEKAAKSVQQVKVLLFTQFYSHFHQRRHYIEGTWSHRDNARAKPFRGTLLPVFHVRHCMGSISELACLCPPMLLKNPLSWLDSWNLQFCVCVKHTTNPAMLTVIRLHGSHSYSLAMQLHIKSTIGTFFLTMLLLQFAELDLAFCQKAALQHPAESRSSGGSWSTWVVDKNCPLPRATRS